MPFLDRSRARVDPADRDADAGWTPMRNVASRHRGLSPNWTFKYSRGQIQFV
jgi:hypothetical protein